MNRDILDYISQISEEEYKILAGEGVDKSLYSSTTSFTVDSNKMLRQNQLVDIRSHCRFVHFPKHTHNYIEIAYMCAGETTHIVNDYVEIKLKCGELLLLNRKAAHEILPCGKDDILVNFIILPEFFIQVFSLVGESSLLFDFIFAHGKADDTGYLHFSAGNILPVQNLVESMIWSIINKVNYSQSVMQGSMGLLILHILNYTDKINQNNPHSYERNIVIGLLKYLESDFQNANLEEYAKKHHISSYTLSKMIKKYTGRNYVTLLQEIRMLEAEKYLTQTDMTVESISSEVGYENNGYFYKLFKERNGMTPFEYRRQKSGNWNIGETEVDSLPKRVW